MATSTGAARTKPSPSAPPQPASSRVPLLLEPHVASGPLARDEGSLTVVTWVQGASANWLLLRYLHALLGDGRGGEQVTGVVLVSFLRDARFWVDGCARLGMDLDALRKSGHFGFVDGLTGSDSPGPGGDGRGHQTDGIKTQVDGALSRLSTPARKVLLVDGLDAHVAMTPAGSAAETESLLMRLRENVYSTLLTFAADEPLMQATQQQQQTATATTSLEREQAALVLGQAHAADQVVSLRRLDTGAAADVSGVLRVATRAGGGGDGEELLYHVSSDGSVRVFERGA